MAMIVIKKMSFSRKEREKKRKEKGKKDDTNGGYSDHKYVVLNYYIMTLLMYRARWFHYAKNDFYEL